MRLPLLSPHVTPVLQRLAEALEDLDFHAAEDGWSAQSTQRAADKVDVLVEVVALLVGLDETEDAELIEVFAREYAACAG
jgi:hypothetical protein